MLQTATIQIKLDPAMKQAVHSLYSSMGLTTTDAVKLFFKQSLNNNALPFEVKAPSGYFTSEEKEEIADDIQKMKKGEFLSFATDEEEVNYFKSL
jgi:DNA-damage-inducible protein J